MAVGGETVYQFLSNVFTRNNKAHIHMLTDKKKTLKIISSNAINKSKFCKLNFFFFSNQHAMTRGSIKAVQLTTKKKKKKKAKLTVNS